MTTPARAARAPLAAVPAPAAGWLVLAIDDLRLALPQQDVRLIGLAADLKPSAGGEGPETGWLLHEDGDSWPAYSLSGGLHLQRPAPAARRVCVFFETAQAVIGLVCDKLTSLATDTELRVQSLPGCMTGLPTPIRHVARHEDGIVAVTSAADLAGYLAGLQEDADGAAG
jgi:hypothetical protein